MVRVSHFLATVEQDGTGIVAAHLGNPDGLGPRLSLLALEQAKWSESEAGGHLVLTPHRPTHRRAADSPRTRS